MRVNEPAARSGGAREAGRRAFAEALDRARRANGTVERERARSGAAGRRAAADAADLALGERRGALAERAPEGGDEPGARAEAAQGSLPRASEAMAPGPAAAAPAAAAFAPEVRTPELRAVLRALPPAVETARVQEGAPLELAFGRALSVELRGGRGGVEIVLRPSASLARAASAELPALVRALRERGVAVARAEVRTAPGKGGSAR
jgi:hypothetical protein